jgi:type II secretory pathway predicted ATPase ExeA
MFLDFFRLQHQPFGGTPDPRFLYLGQSHREALASLFYSIQADCGFTALIAEPGLGKTTLAFQLLEKLQPIARTTFVCQTQCSSRELLQYLLSEVGVDASNMGMIAMHNKLKNICSQEKIAGRRFIIAIDEAQNCDSDVLETIRLLSNPETSHTKLLQVLLIGQPQLARMLATESLIQLQQRISTFARLEPFNLEETALYVAHRLKVAGREVDGLLTREALLMLYNRSHGVPRNINNLCFAAMSLAYATGRQRIDSEIMGEVVADRDSVCFTNESKPSVPGPVASIAPHPHSICNAWFRVRVVRVACVAAMIAVIALLVPFAAQIQHLRQLMSEVSGALSGPTVVSGAVLANTKKAVGTVLAVANEEAKNISTRGTVPAASTGKVPENVSVIVKPGDTLRQIALRTSTRYNPGIIDQILKLNPAMTNPNRIEVGQEIMVPRSVLKAPPIVVTDPLGKD